jgi:iron complex outermembrane recepter protein
MNNEEDEGMERAKPRPHRNLSQAIALALGAAGLSTALSQTTSFDVPEQPAASAIPEFARQAHVQIIAPADKLVGVSTHTVHGVLDIRAALKQLLEGTGLAIASDDGHTISLRSTDTPRARSTASTAESAGTQLDEIMVTAQRRTESAQHVPITLQVLTGEAISQLNVATFDDFLKYLPNVTSDGYGPGQGDIYMRGLSFTQCRAATSTSMPRTWSALRFSKVRRARCSAQAHRRA